MSTALTEAQEAADAARREAKEFFDAHPDPRTMSADDIAKAKEHKAKMADLHDKAAEIEEIEVARTRANAKRESAGKTVGLESDKSEQGASVYDFGQSLRDNAAFMQIVKGKEQISGRKGFSLTLTEVPDFGAFKTVITLGDINVPATRLPGIVASAQESATIADLILPGTTDNNTITYMEETTFTNAAAEVAEGDPKAEAALDFTERTENVRKIATWVPVTDELLADVAGFESYLRGRLSFMVQRREESQLINGDGTAPNISGFLDRTNLQTQTSGLTHEADAIYAAITKIRANAFAEPTGVVINPLSWANIRTEKDDNEQYLGPGPFAADAVDRIWGLPVRVTSAIAEGKALVGAFRPHSQIFRRTGITVALSTEHDTYFTSNKVAVLAEERLALAVYRPAAFCVVTGLASS